MATGTTTSAKHAIKLQRQADALELRRAGIDYRSIARRLGIGRSTAHELVRDALAEVRAQIDGEASELKAEELSRLDALLACLWRKKAQLGAVDRILRVMERRAKLLGLDAPVKLAHEGKNGGPIAHRNDGIDLDSLTDAELDAYEALVAASAQRRAGGSGTGEAPA